MTNFKHFIKLAVTSALFALGLSGFVCEGFAQTAECAAIDAAALGQNGLEITATKFVAAEGAQPAHCLLTGSLDKRTGEDGHAYAIGFEMRLPVSWNGRFLHQLNGGNEGEVLPALGATAPFSASGGTSPLARGFAVLSSDSGHSARDPANEELGVAAGAAFGLDPQARRDYGYSADLKLAPVARAIIMAHYGRKADYSYMFGCSNGGRHAMVNAARMPEQYDGFLVGNPGFDLPKAAVQHAWDVQHLLKIDSDIRKTITVEDVKLIDRRVLEVCDALDGLKDGLTANLRACSNAFDFDRLACTPGESGTCLPPVKASALKAMFGGPRNSRGEQLYSDWPIDAGIGTGNWRAWKIESPVAAWNNYSIISVMGAASLAMIFTTPPTKIGGSNAELVNFLANFDFDRDAPKIYATSEKFTPSAMDFMTPPDVANPKLQGLRQANRKMIIYHGQADPVFSVNDTISWYQKLDTNTGGKADANVRLFTVPGVTHCGGGAGLDRFDALTALTDWVEMSKPPENIVASATPGNKDIPQDWSTTRTRPLCPWPKFARYVSGDPETDTSFACAAP
jgi:feruloyl esterase